MDAAVGRMADARYDLCPNGASNACTSQYRADHDRSADSRCHELCGNTGLYTPAMDALAANGVRFTRAYAAQPLCTPSRVSIFTGRMPHETGFSINASAGDAERSASLLMMGKIFSDAGYKTGYVGKWHLPVPVGRKQQHGFDFVENTGSGDYTDAATPARCAQFIKENAGNPFLLVASFLNPHDICEWARGDDLKMDLLPYPPDVALCPPLPANWRIPSSEPEMVREQQHSNARTYPSLNWSASQWRRYRWAYNRLVEKVDNYIGMVTGSIKKYKLEENTIIIFTSDHGDGYAAHQWNQKQVLYEESAKVPFIISKPGQWKARTDSRLVCNGTDIIPTICDFAGIAVPSELKGLSVARIIRQPQAPWRDTLVIETEFADNDRSLGIKGRAVLTANMKYIVYDRGKLREQLFDLDKDPGEMNNLAVQKAYAGRLKELRSYLIGYCKQHRDGFNAWDDQR